MLKTLLICGLAAGGAGLPAPAREFPLEFKTIPPTEVMGFPGGYGRYASVRQVKPADLSKEPAATSARPLYGQIGESGKKPMLLRLDESKGTGGGYDRLIIDLNRNRDLTDDPVIEPEPAFTPQVTAARERRLFGPILAPSEPGIGPARPVYYAELMLSGRRSLTNTTLPRLNATLTRLSTYLGSLRLKAAWYLEASVEANGRTQKIGAYDGDADLGLGDAWQSQYYGQDKKQWYFSNGDCILWDADGSGKFENNQFSTESNPWSGLVWFDATPSRISFAPDWKSVTVEPWQGDLGVLAVQPEGGQVRVLNLAWQHAPDQWQLVKARGTDGKFQVPPGSYRLYQDLLAADAGGGNQVAVAGSTRTIADTLKVEAGQTTPLRCGGPLEAKLTAERAKYGLVTDRAADAYVLNIQAQIVGQAGEICSSFALGKGFGAEDPPAPVFKVLDQNGRTLASGKMEFG